MDDILTAKKILDSGYSVVLCYNGMVLTNKKSEEVALSEFIESKLDFSNFTIALKEINSHISCLIVQLNVKSIVTYKLSDIAKEELEKNGIKCNYKDLINELEN